MNVNLLVRLEKAVRTLLQDDRKRTHRKRSKRLFHSLLQSSVNKLELSEKTTLSSKIPKRRFMNLQ